MNVPYSLNLVVRRSERGEILFWIITISSILAAPYFVFFTDWISGALLVIPIAISASLGAQHVRERRFRAVIVIDNPKLTLHDKNIRPGGRFQPVGECFTFLAC